MGVPAPAPGAVAVAVPFQYPYDLVRGLSVRLDRESDTFALIDVGYSQTGTHIVTAIADACTAPDPSGVGPTASQSQYRYQWIRMDACGDANHHSASDTHYTNKNALRSVAEVRDPAYNGKAESLSITEADVPSVWHSEVAATPQKPLTANQQFATFWFERFTNGLSAHVHAVTQSVEAHERRVCVWTVACVSVF